MSLFSSIQMAGNTLRANEIGLQVVGQNIANANTPGYIREEAIFTPGPTQKYGGLLLGLGVTVDAVVQKIDEFLEARLRGAVSDAANNDALQDSYAQLEGVVGALGSSNLGTAMNEFFASISEILNQPDSAAVRNLAVLQGETLTGDINRMSTRTQDLRTAVNDRIKNMAADINRLTNEIATLNVRIADAEGGNVSKSDAVGLRDQRGQALQNLAALIDIRTAEQPSGTVTVYRGGDYLVNEGTFRAVRVSLSSDRGLSVASIDIADIDAPLAPSSGELRGLLDARDVVFGGFLDQLDDFAVALASEFNKIYSGGQGLSGYVKMTAQSGVDDPDQPLNATGLKLEPKNGSFQVLIHNTQTGLTTTTDVNVSLTGSGRDMTFNDLKAKLASISGLIVEQTIDNRLILTSAAQDQEFAFSHDTSGVLASLGLNTFFTGSGARDLGINADVIADPGKFAASSGGIATDTNTAIQLAQFLDRPLESRNGQSIGLLYNRLTSEVSQGSAVAQATAKGTNAFEATLRGQVLSTSGVNVDEEAIAMLGFQRAYQAAAKYIAALNELFQILVTI